VRGSIGDGSRARPAGQCTKVLCAPE
jgi:hypothetical protein